MVRVDVQQDLHACWPTNHQCIGVIWRPLLVEVEPKNLLVSFKGPRTTSTLFHGFRHDCPSVFVVDSR